MIYRVSKKQVTEAYDAVVAVPYGYLETVLSYKQMEAYTDYKDNWASDIYGFGNGAISTGYTPFGNVKPSFKLMEKFEEEAREICAKYAASNAEWRLNILARQFIDAAVAEAKKGGKK